MIPLSSKEHVEYADPDGIVWRFLPLFGDMEREFFSLQSGADEKTAIAQMGEADTWIDKVLVGWSGEKMPKYPDDKKPSRLFSQSEKGTLFSYWMKANKLTAEEKKS